MLFTKSSICVKRLHNVTKVFALLAISIAQMGHYGSVCEPESVRSLLNETVVFLTVKLGFSTIQKSCLTLLSLLNVYTVFMTQLHQLNVELSYLLFVHTLPAIILTFYNLLNDCIKCLLPF